MLHVLKAIARRVLPSAVVGRLRSWQLARLVRRYRPRTASHTYAGHTLKIQLTDPLAEGWYDHDWPEQPEIRFLKHHRLRSGATAFDLGAHQGIVALVLAREVGPGGWVVAVEANPHNAAACEANARMNDAANLTVRWAAVAERAGEVTFNLGLNGQVDDATGGWGRVQVPAVTVDQLTEEFGPPDVLVVDVEGFECQVLRGAADTLVSHRPDVVIEVHIATGLEKFGSVGELLRCFPREYEFYRLQIENTSAEPTPATVGDLLTETARFYLLAVHRG